MYVVFSHPRYAHGPIKEGYASQTFNQNMVETVEESERLVTKKKEWLCYLELFRV